MESFLAFFEQLSNLEKLAWIFIVLSFCWILEAGIPLVKMQYNKLKHIRVNLVFLAFTITINALFGILTVGIFNWLEVKEFGLLNMVNLPLWVELVIGILILDLIAQYYVHYLLHRIKWMWKLHMVHHSDTHVDATTGTRHHPGDYLMREVFALGAVVIAGLPFAFYMVYRITTVLTTYITHANILFPRWLDKTLSYIFITPNMHKFHHHFERPWTDTNFGNIFSIWDRIFGTFVYDDTTKIKYGLDVLSDETDEDIIYQLKIPINKEIKTDY
jgi:sterol desaturase/sphingolipid hydroxylase (fatty acid hydroxylase superfamily)